MYKTLEMYMHVLSLSEFRAHASEMVDLVQAGETVRILRHGKPVAELVAVKAEAVDETTLAWKQPFEPLKIQWPAGQSGAKLIIEERENARF